MVTEKIEIMARLNDVYSNLADQDIGDEILMKLNDVISLLDKYDLIEAGKKSESEQHDG